MSLSAALLGAAIASLLASAAWAAAGGYTVEPPDDKQFANSQKVRTILTAAQPGPLAASDRTLLDDYFNKYSLARWTVPDNVGKIYFTPGPSGALIGGYRNELRNAFRQAKQGPAYDYLNSIVLKTLNKYASGNYHPTTRVNAILMIGELNAAEPPINVPPDPLPAAGPVLVAAAGAKDQIEAVRVAALVGILRHLRLGGMKESAVREGLGKLALEMVRANEPPAGRTPDAHGWLRAQTADILGELGSAGRNAEVATALGTLVRDSKAPMNARRAAAKALGRLNMSGAGGGAQLAKALARFAADACLIEENQAPSHRRLADRAFAASEALGNEQRGVHTAASDDQARKALAEVEPLLQELVKVLNSKPDDASVVGKTQPLREKLEKAAK